MFYEQTQSVESSICQGTIVDDRFRVGKVIGSGSFSTVHECIDTKLPGRNLVIKISERVEMIEQEV